MPRVAALLALLLVAATGCEDAVDPTLGTEQAFSLYGYLDPTADRQAIRVVPITDTLDPDSTDVLDVTMTATEPATGRTATFRDSLVTYDDGSTGHVFVADYTPTPGTTVELAVSAPDRQAATVSVQTPPLAQPTVGAPSVDFTGAVYPVSVGGIPRVLGGALRVFVTGVPNTTGETAIDIPLPALNITTDGLAWTVEVPFLGAVRDHLRAINLFNAGLVLVDAEFRAFVANEAWAVPRGGFDLDAIAEPGTFSNVMGGFGFVGAGYLSPVRWLPSTNVQSLAGFAVVNDPAARIAINEIGNGYVELFNPTPEAISVSGYILTTGRADEGVRIPAPGAIAARGYLRVPGPFTAAAGTTLQYLTGAGRLLSTMYVEEASDAWGAYPDGYSYQLPQGGPNLFHGPLAPTPNGTNRPAIIPAVLNELSTSGDGFVEVFVTAVEFDLEQAAVATSPEALAFRPSRLAGDGSLLVADEDDRLVLDQVGGDVFLLYGSQVVDARFYGPQTPERSVGYLPDGPDGAWTLGLRPTRGAPNAAARFGS